MCRRRPVTFVYLLAGVIVSLGCGSQNDPGEQSRAGGILRRMAANPALCRPEQQGATYKSMGEPRYGLGSSHQICWIHELMPEEEELLRLGAESVPPVLGELRRVKVCLDMRVRLAILLGRLENPSALDGLFEAVERGPEPLVREACVTAIGMIRQPSCAARLARSLGAGTVPEPVLTWAIAMCGDFDRARECFDRVDRVLASEQCEDAAEGFPKNDSFPSTGASQLTLRAKKNGDSERLPLDLWRLSHLRDVRTVGTLASALRYHDPLVQHMAIDLLRDLVAEPPLEVSPGEYALHSLETYGTWNDWWQNVRKSLRWNAERRKYVCPTGN